MSLNNSRPFIVLQYTRRLHNMVKILTIPIFLDKKGHFKTNYILTIDNVLINSQNQTLH